MKILSPQSSPEGRGFWNFASLLSALSLALILPACSSAPATPRPAEAEPGSIASVETVKVVSRRLDLVVPLPGELQPYETVGIY
ncbi:MAG TPA: hypothetical protein VKT29_08240, partial [Terriglobales bacterium]|nr:hypothetical protein [Terriglobales bacterium]